MFGAHYFFCSLGTHSICFYVPIYSKNEAIFMTGTGTWSKDSVPFLIGSKGYGSGNSGSVSTADWKGECNDRPRVPWQEGGGAYVCFLWFSMILRSSSPFWPGTNWRQIGQDASPPLYRLLIFHQYDVPVRFDSTSRGNNTTDIRQCNMSAGEYLKKMYVSK